ncbi:MAG: hypothetical protein ACRD2L_19295, partial [Terriglobia bacterium]
MCLRWRGIFPMVCASFVLGQAAVAQQRADGRLGYERLVAVVPMVGAGTFEDPRRPAYVPAARDLGKKPQPTDILAFTYQVSDDGQFALVEFVAGHPLAFKAILSESKKDAAIVKAFEVGKAKRSDIEKELRKHKKDLDLDQLGSSLP